MPGAVPVGEADDPFEAGIWVDALQRAGITATVFERSLSGALGGAATSWARYPVLVSRDSLGAARNVIADLAGAARLAPYDDPNTSRARQGRAVRLLTALIAVIVVAAVIARELA